MPENILYRFNPLLISLALIGVLLAAEEVGFRVKRRTKPVTEGIERGDIALILGAVLTLLALMLGFTYSMSENRFETRRQLVIEEANAIGTTYLRAKTLPEPRSSEIRELLRRYAGLRAGIGGRKDDTPEKIREVNNQAKQLHDSIWSHAAVLARENPNPIVSIFLQTLNEMIDFHSKRLAAFRNRVPFVIYLVLFVISSITFLLLGYYLGTRRQRVRILSMMLALLVAAVMWLILDLDQPVRGAIRASQQSLIDLQQDLSQRSQNPTETTRMEDPAN
jgi:hypothetical protein